MTFRHAVKDPSYCLKFMVSQYPVFSFLFSESSAASSADWQAWNELNLRTAQFPPASCLCW